MGSVRVARAALTSLATLLVASFGYAQDSAQPPPTPTHRPRESNGLSALGRVMFRTAEQISDYLQSVTAETKSRPAKLPIP